MFRNYLKVTVRNLLKHKAFSVINILGLTVGFTSCLLIGLYVQHEASFDHFQRNGDRIARVIMEYGSDGSPEIRKGNYTSTKVAPVFKRTFPEVESAVRMVDRDVIVKNGNDLVSERNFIFTDSTFFNIFSFTMLEGNPDKALDGPFKVVLTRSTAARYFPGTSPLGQILLLGSDGKPYEVTGVVEDYPSNSQIQFDFLASFSSLGVNQEETYFNANYTTYLLLHDARAFEALQKKITPFMKKEMSGSGNFINFILEPFDKVHLYSAYGGFVPNTSIVYLYVLSGVALLILVIVSFTYINLSTARSVERAREVGIRKVVGARKSQLFWQFIGEAFMMCSIGVVLSVNLAMMMLPSFNELTGKHLQAEGMFSYPFVIVTVLVTTMVSVAAGSYPAVVLARFQPVKVLKGVFRNTNSGRLVQQSLTVFQFSISVLLLVSTLVIQKQLHFIQTRKLGYDRDHILVLPMNMKMMENISVIKNELTAHPDISVASRCASTPVDIASGYGMRSSQMAERDNIPVFGNPVDEHYVKTTGLQMIAGDDFTEQDMKDGASPEWDERIYHFILNRSAAARLGWAPEEAIGKKMFLGDHRPGFVKGVVEDFHFQSMHKVIEPLVLFNEARGHGHLLVKIAGNNVRETISSVEATWKQLVPYAPFEYRFLDDDFAAMYKSELRLGHVMNVFAAIAMVLACAGLFGLSSYVVQQRVKEIGIRKILGASVFNILGIVSGNFTKVVVIAIFAGSAVAYTVMEHWLQNFAYRIDIQWWIVVVVGLLVMGVALLTVSFQAVKAAIANPVDSLRSE